MSIASLTPHRSPTPTKACYPDPPNEDAKNVHRLLGTINLVGEEDAIVGVAVLGVLTGVWLMAT